MLHRIAIAIACATYASALTAQQVQPSIGTIATRDALVTGALQVQNDHAQLLTTASVTAYSATAPIELTRGGDVLVCATSRLHVSQSGKDTALVFALDRGAIEIHSDSQLQDVVITSDLRLTFMTAGRLDLRLRVTSNGDTCVENTGRSAPQISISDAFSDSSYLLRPDQHVLFEHGSVREVVDQEKSPCGCPTESAPPARVAQDGSGQASDAATRNPFPAAVSQGLAPEAKPLAPAPRNEALPVADSVLSYQPVTNATSEKPADSNQGRVSVTQPAAPNPPPSPPGAHDIVHAIGRFFKRLFGNKPEHVKS